jgi:hypothetical protein
MHSSLSQLVSHSKVIKYVLSLTGSSTVLVLCLYSKVIVLITVASLLQRFLALRLYILLNEFKRVGDLGICSEAMSDVLSMLTDCTFLTYRLAMLPPERLNTF